ncbi:MAG: YdaU family protein [Phenylobacterium sp.]|uniref:YdaU family protein n=1 Tax=Phenylobacterium sp. TaxID=1871053 RepID=UPI002728E342|nr:YdaU family protein [Phenylobacterium sp.]MDO8912316.1 YdaU family protein [Phenylobacterium sp.]MDP3099528.1 YdaU family protein [Phenylobacterium sp.]
MSKDAKPDAWMPLYIGDWDGDTGHLDCEQDGAYGRLVRWYWRNGPPRDDDATLARIIRMDLKRWKKVRLAIAPFFAIAEGVWRHKRVDEELVRWADKRRRAIERASAGGRAKAAKSSASSTPQAVLRGVLDGCTSASSTEVDAPTGQSTLCDEDSISDLKKESLDDERSWAFAISEAERDELRCRRSDPDLNSELCEFIATGRAEVARLRRARLNIVESSDHSELAA